LVVVGGDVGGGEVGGGDVGGGDVGGGEVGAGEVGAGPGVDFPRVVGVERPRGVVVVAPLKVVGPGEAAVVDGPLVVGPAAVVVVEEEVVESAAWASTLIGLPLLMGSGKPAMPTPMAAQTTSKPMSGPRFTTPPSESIGQD